MRLMGLEEARRVMDTAKRVHDGALAFPPEIQELDRQIALATRKALLFAIKLNIVDEGMVNEVIALMLKRDELLEKFVS